MAFIKELPDRQKRVRFLNHYPCFVRTTQTADDDDDNTTRDVISRQKLKDGVSCARVMEKNRTHVCFCPSESLLPPFSGWSKFSSSVDEKDDGEEEEEEEEDKSYCTI